MKHDAKQAAAVSTITHRIVTASNTAASIIGLAQKHVEDPHNAATMKSSAALRLADAKQLEQNGFPTMAQRAALDSLAYSVGVMHDDYQKAARLHTRPQVAI